MRRYLIAPHTPARDLRDMQRMEGDARELPYHNVGNFVLVEADDREEAVEKLAHDRPAEYVVIDVTDHEVVTSLVAQEL